MGWLAALNPTLVMYTTCIASENAFMPGVAGFLLVSSLSARASGLGGSVALSAAAGVAGGIVGYIRATIAMVGAVVPVVMLRYTRNLRRSILLTGTVAVFAGLTLAPWAMRNHAEFGVFHPFSLNGSSNLWMGNHEGTTGGYAPLPAHVVVLPLTEREEVLGREAREFILGDPLRYLRLSAHRLLVTMRSDTIAVTWNSPGIGNPPLETALKVLTTGFHYALWAVVLASVAWAVRGMVRVKFKTIPWDDVICWVALVSLIFPAVFIVSGNRYHLPLIPMASILACSFIVERLSPREATKNV